MAPRSLTARILVAFAVVSIASWLAIGATMFVALRGPVPLSGDPHNAQGSTPGLGIIQVTDGGRSGSLMARVPLTNANQQPSNPQKSPATETAWR